MRMTKLEKSTVVEGLGAAPLHGEFCVIEFAFYNASNSTEHDVAPVKDEKYLKKFGKKETFLFGVQDAIPPIVHEIVGNMKCGEICTFTIHSTELELSDWCMKHLGLTGENISPLLFPQRCLLKLSNIEQLVDISTERDGSITMIALDEYSAWEKPEKLCKVKVSYLIKLQNGNTLVDKACSGESLSFIVDENEVAEAVDLAVRLMTIASTAYIVLKGKHMSTELNTLSNTCEKFGSDSAVHLLNFRIEEMQNPVAISLLDASGKVGRAEGMLENGNRWFRLGKTEKALCRFEQGLQAVEYLGGMSEAEDYTRVRPLLHRLKLNACQCHLKLMQYREAVNLADEVLRWEPENEKALYRKIAAMNGLLRFDEAETLARKSIALFPNSKQLRMLLKTIVEASTKNASLQTTYKKMWSGSS